MNSNLLFTSFKFTNIADSKRINNPQNLKTSNHKDSISFTSNKPEFDITKDSSKPECIATNPLLDKFVNKIIDEADIVKFKLLNSIGTDLDTAIGECNEFIDYRIIPILTTNWSDIKRFIVSNVIDKAFDTINNPTQTNGTHLKYQYLRLINEFGWNENIAELSILPIVNNSLKIYSIFCNNTSKRDKLKKIASEMLSSNLPNNSVIRNQFKAVAYKILAGDLNYFSNWKNPGKAQETSYLNAIEYIKQLGDYNIDTDKLLILLSKNKYSKKVKSKIKSTLNEFYNKADSLINAFDKSVLGKNGPTGIDLLNAKRCIATISTIQPK